MEKIPFKIEKMDPFAQGVSRLTGVVNFVIGALPGEEGLALIIEKKKNLVFSKLMGPDDLKIISPKRIEENCPHYQKCSACHYLHTDYENELFLKREALNELINKLQFKGKIETIPSKQRFFTRNRIQLHFKKSEQKIGLHSKKSHEILEIPNCLQPEEPILNKLKEIYENKESILESLPGNIGTIEFYHYKNKVYKNINAPYAKQGFTQVNSSTSEYLNKTIHQWLGDTHYGEVTELFSGDGQLSKNIKFKKRFLFDSYDHKLKDFYQLNLYKKDAPQKVYDHTGTVDLLILDPPRSGLKNLREFTDKLKAKTILYVACSPQTMVRDLKLISHEYSLQRVALIDLFPATHHFETMCLLRSS